MFTDQIKEHFEHPRNSGEVLHSDASIVLENPVCGDVLQLTLRVSHDRIEEIRFRAQGCVPLIACASALTELVKGQSVNTARTLHYTQITEALGGLPSASTHAGHLAIKALVQRHSIRLHLKNAPRNPSPAIHAVLKPTGKAPRTAPAYSHLSPSGDRRLLRTQCAPGARV